MQRHRTNRERLVMKPSLQTSIIIFQFKSSNKLQALNIFLRWNAGNLLLGISYLSAKNSIVLCHYLSFLFLVFPPFLVWSLLLAQFAVSETHFLVHLSIASLYDLFVNCKYLGLRSYILVLMADGEFVIEGLVWKEIL